MNKFVLLLCFLLFLNFSKCEETINYEQYYDYLVKVLQGLCPNGEAECAAIFINHKSQLLPLLTNIINDFINGDDTTTIMARYMFSIMAIDTSLLTKCNIADLIGVMRTFDSVESIQALGNRIANKSQQILSNVQLLQGVEGLENKLFYVGRILSLVLGFTVS